MCHSPNFKIPIASSTQPAMKANIIANSGGLSTVYCNVNKAIRLVGPMDTSFTVPKNTYINEPATIERVKREKKMNE